MKHNRLSCKNQDEIGLRSLEKNLLRVFDDHRDGLLIVDDGGVVRYSNQAARGLLGRECLENQDFGLPLLEGETTEIDLIRPGTTPGIAEMSVQATAWNGRAAWLVSLRDVTDLRLKEQALKRAQKLDAVGQLAGGIAHDFNNLLMAIRGFTELIEMKLGPSHPALPDLDGLRRAVKDSGTLTGKLLTFSRNSQPEVQVLELNSALADIESTLRRLLRDNITLNLKLCEQPIHILLDPSDLTQILLNLVLNAQSAIKQSGTLIIELRKTSVNEHPTLPRGNYAELVVADTGTGIHPDIQAKVFEPFFTTKGPDMGTGLGLSICYNIIEQCGGEMTFFTQLGEGTTFSILFPLTRSQSNRVIERESAEKKQSSLKSVLLVDDHPQVRTATGRFLGMLGHHVTVAQDAEHALALVQSLELKIDLLISDVVMPGLSGLELAEILLKTQPEMRFIFISGYSQNQIPESWRAHTLQKPFGLDELRRRISLELEC